MGVSGRSGIVRCEVGSTPSEPMTGIISCSSSSWAGTDNSPPPNWSSNPFPKGPDELKGAKSESILDGTGQDETVVGPSSLDIYTVVYKIMVEG